MQVSAERGGRAFCRKTASHSDLILGALEPQILALRGESILFHQHGPQDPGGRKRLEDKPRHLQPELGMNSPVDLPVNGAWHGQG
ncbi:hypothetical protein CapIbe_021659 [Capra ibex]